MLLSPLIRINWNRRKTKRFKPLGFSSKCNSIISNKHFEHMFICSVWLNLYPLFFFSCCYQVIHHVYLKPERLTKRSSPDDLQLKIKIIYDYSVDQSVLQQLAAFWQPEICCFLVNWHIDKFRKWGCCCRFLTLLDGLFLLRLPADKRRLVKVRSMTTASKNGRKCKNHGFRRGTCVNPWGYSWTVLARI